VRLINVAIGTIRLGSIPAGRLEHRSHQRQYQSKYGSFSRIAGDAKRPAHADGDRVVGNVQAQTGAALTELGGKEGIKYAFTGTLRIGNSTA
jgi:hypothetical protein